MSYINITLKVNGTDDDSAVTEALEAIAQLDESVMVDYQLTDTKSENNKLAGIVFTKKDAEILKKFAENKQVVINDKKITKSV